MAPDYTTSAPLKRAVASGSSGSVDGGKYMNQAYSDFGGAAEFSMEAPRGDDPNQLELGN
jgi:hypothetical protein